MTNEGLTPHPLEYKCTAYRIRTEESQFRIC
jgi:hypothetical protein